MSDPQREAVEAAVLGLARDLREWLEWAELTGASAVPFPEQAPRIPAYGARAQQHAPPRARQHPHRAQRQAPPPQAPPRPGPQAGAPAARPAPGETLEEIRKDLGNCTRCKLASGRKNIVFGVGNPRADLVIVGEGPGRYEDLTGEPFVGRAGQLLNRMLGAIGLRREDVYICNVIKCRPPNNRDPEHDEVAACSPFLHRQVRSLGPRAILAVGGFAGKNLSGLDETVGRLRRDVRSFLGVPVVVSYHPAFLLRRPRFKRTAYEDLLKVKALLRGDPPG